MSGFLHVENHAIAAWCSDNLSDIKENKDKLNEAEKATDELGNKMNDTAKQTNISGEVLKSNLAANFIKVLA